MLLFVIGLVAVIIAVVVGVFLTRRRRDDDDDEPGGRQTVRDRLGSRGRDGRLRTDPRMARKPAGRGPAPSRRPAGEPRGYGGPGRGYESAGFDQSRGYEPSPRGYGERAPRSRDDQRTERIPAARSGGRYQDAPEPATPVGARASRAASAPRRGGVGTDTGPGGNALYDTGPSSTDFTATRINADPDLADSDVFPRVRAEIPETEAKARPKNQAKGRGRTSRGRHDDDDDDWPSTEWDKLSDEQYWAELSADKPLATTARSAQPSPPVPAATPAKPSRAASQPPASGRAPARPQAAPDAEPDGTRRRQPADRPRADGQPSGHAAADGWRGHRPGAPRRPGRPARGRGRHGAVAGPPPACRGPGPGCSGAVPARRPRAGPGPGRGRPADQPALRAGRSRRGRQPLLPDPQAQSRPAAGPSGRPGLPERAERLPQRDRGVPGQLSGLLRRLPGCRAGRHRASHQPGRASPQQRALPRPGQLRRPGARQLCRPVRRL